MTGVEAAGAKVALPLVKAGVKAAWAELARQAPAGTVTDLSSYTEVLEEALRVLAQDEANLFSAGLIAAKGLVSRPVVFEHAIASTWIKTEKAQNLLIQAASQLLRAQYDETPKREAREFYESVAALSDDATAPSPELVVDEALDFMRRSLKRKLSPADALHLAVGQGLSDQLTQQTSTIVREISRQGRTPRAELIDELVDAELNAIRRRRFFNGAATIADATALATQVRTGDFVGSSPQTRARALAWCARLTAIEGDADEVRGLIGRSRELFELEESIIALAFLESRSGWEKGFEILGSLNTPSRCTAALLIHRQHHQPAQNVAWFDDNGLTLDDLDPDGKVVLINGRLASGQLNAAYQDATRITELDLTACPALYGAVSSARLSRVVSPSLFHIVHDGLVPFDPRGFPLGNTPADLREIHQAALCLHRGAVEVGSLKLSRIAALMEAAALWLDLRHPDNAEAAALVLGTKLRDREHQLIFLPLALAFELPVDRVEANLAIKRSTALKLDGNADAAAARLALIVSDPSVDNALEQLNSNRSVLTAHLDPSGLLSIEIQLLMQAERFEEARLRLAEEQEGLAPALRNHLEGIIGGEGDGATVEQLEELYAAAPSTATLAQLAEKLKKQGYSERYFEVGLKYVKELRQVELVEEFIHDLVAAKRYDQAEKALSELSEYVTASDSLQSNKAWIDYRRGRLTEVEPVVRRLLATRDDRNDRALYVNFLTVSGRWSEFTHFIENEWNARAKRTAAELADLAKLASSVRSPRARELMDEAAGRGQDDPKVLLKAFSAATDQGIEDATTAGWLQKAIALSGPDGPIQPASLKDLLDREPEWQSRVETVWGHIAAGEAPLSISATALRRPWIELYLAPLINNASEADPRRRSIVPLYHGRRRQGFWPSEPPRRLGVDRSALLTFSHLGILDAVVENYEVVIPHRTLAWLLEEQQRFVHHQPSQIASARHLARLLGSRRVLEFVPSTKPNSDLQAAVGSQLASMIEAASNDVAARSLVVHPFPVTRVGSLLEEVVDLSAHKERLCSCSAVVEKLASLGVLTAADKARAEAYLSRTEKRWPDEPALSDGATLYLSDLSVDYLRFIGVLDKLLDRGFEVFVSGREVKEAYQLLEFEAFSGEILKAVDNLRQLLEREIRTGRVRLDEDLAQYDGDDDAEGEASARRNDPSFAAVQLAQNAGALIVDDRCFNRFDTFEGETINVPLMTSADVLDDLRRRDRIDDDRYWSTRATLWKTAAVFIGTSSEEFIHFISEARAAGASAETGELRAIRENIELAQSRGWLQIPLEADWHIQLSSAVADAIVSLWQEGIPDDEAHRWSDWLFGLADYRNWAGTGRQKPGLGMAEHGETISLARLSVAWSRVEAASQQRYGRWLEAGPLARLKNDEPAEYAWLLDHLRTLLRGAGDAQSLNADDS